MKRYLGLHRFLSMLMMGAVLGAEEFMHAFNIPHVEGWWVPLLGGGAVAAVSGCLCHWKKKFHRDSACCHHGEHDPHRMR